MILSLIVSKEELDLLQMTETEVTVLLEDLLEKEIDPYERLENVCLQVLNP